MTTTAQLRPIVTEADYEAALAIVARLMDAKVDSTAGRLLDGWVTLIEAYEARHWAIDLPDPIDAIRARMEQKQLRAKDLIRFLGSSGRVSEVLRGRRSLTLPMIRRLESGLGIPANVLIQTSLKPGLPDPPAAP